MKPVAIEVGTSELSGTPQASRPPPFAPLRVTVTFGSGVGKSSWIIQASFCTAPGNSYFWRTTTGQKLPVLLPASTGARTFQSAATSDLGLVKAWPRRTLHQTRELLRTFQSTGK